MTGTGTTGGYGPSKSGRFRAARRRYFSTRSLATPFGGRRAPSASSARLAT
jgi:hypothetical protein